MCPEIPLRLSSIYEYLQLQPFFSLLTQMAIAESSLKIADGQVIAWEAVERIHPLAQINKIYQKSKALPVGDNDIDVATDTYMNMHTFSAARIAVDAVLTAVDAVLSPEASAQVKKAYALVRPPGHHAHAEIAGGFCFFNNVAVAAARCRDMGKRVLIVDWDIHHGDATQNSFYDSPEILLIGLHRLDEGTFYPAFVDDKKPEFIGAGKGLGFNVNVAWETGTVVNEYDRGSNTVAELGAHEYKLAFDEIVLPLATEFAPDVILVSCGFDSGIGDPIGLSKLSPMMYFWMTHKLR